MAFILLLYYKFVKWNKEVLYIGSKYFGKPRLDISIHVEYFKASQACVTEDTVSKSGKQEKMSH